MDVALDAQTFVGQPLRKLAHEVAAAHKSRAHQKRLRYSRLADHWQGSRQTRLIEDRAAGGDFRCDYRIFDAAGQRLLGEVTGLVLQRMSSAMGPRPATTRTAPAAAASPHRPSSLGPGRCRRCRTRPSHRDRVHAGEHVV